MRAPERILLHAAAALVLTAPLWAQAAAPAAPAPAGTVPAAAAGGAVLPETDVYRREVFRYQTGGRPDPFRPLLDGEDMGVRAQDLQLVGIIHSSNPRASVAVFTLPNDDQRVRLRVGQRLGAVTVVSIQPRRVDLREEALGVSRTYTLELQRTRRPVATQGDALQDAPASAPVQGPADRARQAQPGQTPTRP
ncbi:hypothetical protein [Longimicrobium sp.]|uniref:hypothetical protein n=1 Tax=Longimicrobium sp. TaxID=2029185 RepID=UPI002E3244FA|nr:hypothetical protein [Longimicrobium sp.]HEX6042028.1 hypothetical protein [Longimicrobium sp.]